jgi:sortase A
MGAIRYWPLAAVLVTAAFSIQAAWIPVKAELAQWLLEQAWRRSESGTVSARPWPWADTYPVAELSIPRLGLRQLVLAGASGRNLAFGPTALTPVDGRDVVLSAHRDTHFSDLRELSAGDEIRLSDHRGSRRYRVTWLEVVDSRERELVLDDSLDRLTLVTCWPFDAPTAGGPMRWVVTALPSIET